MLGLGGDLLPVVPDAQAAPSPGSKVKAFGKIPSLYTPNGAAGIARWTELTITSEDISHWSADRRLGMCVRTSAVRAIDCDIEDEAMALEVHALILAMLPGAATRLRQNSTKWLIPFHVPGAQKKRIIATEHGRIEFLADGQQFVAAGTHPSGAPYVWAPERPQDLPMLSPELFDELWDTLARRFSKDPEHKLPSLERPATQAAPIDRPELTVQAYDDLRDALKYKPLLEAAADNSTWSEIGYALLGLNEIGWEEWTKFSRAASGYQPGAPEQWWDTHKMQPARSDWRHIFTLARKLGWRSIADPLLFPIVTEPAGEPPGDELPADVPQAHYLCTDLRNANRLRVLYGTSHLIVVGGAFYAWTGQRWQRDEGEAARCVAKLSGIVREEARVQRELFDALTEDKQEAVRELRETSRRDQTNAVKKLRALPDGPQAYKALQMAEALEAWAKECEMQPRQQRALSQLRTLLSADTVELDTDRDLVNCLNGTVNLRTGMIKAHDQRDYITRLAPVNYVPDAQAPIFERTVLEIMNDEELRAKFLQRWFGYAVTGEVREQKMLLHIGGGSNGKSTLLETVEYVFGDYTHTGAAGLLTVSANDRHPTEIADLAGRRLVTIHESEEGAVLREGLLKQATGGDRLTGRFMFKDFFTFSPTHKFQLLTNHQPVVRGQDAAIWRRLLLVKYTLSYGTEEEVAAGKRSRVGDPMLKMKLLEEREGIFAWVVRGAMQWYASGLKPPDGVLKDSEDYRSEQDRVAEFVKERCIVDAEAWAPFSGPEGVYPAYARWCRESGFFALNIHRFIGELERVLNNFRRHDPKKIVDGVRRMVRGFYGAKLDPDGDGGGFKQLDSNEDLL